MRFLWYFAVVAISLAFISNVRAENDAAAAIVAEQPAEQVALVEMDSATTVAEEPTEQITLLETDSPSNGDGEKNREVRQFGFYRPRPFYGGGYYRPPPFYGGGYYRPRPPPFYGGYYRPRPPPFFGIGFFG